MGSDNTQAPFSIDKKRGVLIPMGLVATAILALLGAGWTANGLLTSIHEENIATRQAVEALKAEVQAAAKYRWTAGDMERWAYLLERSNRDLKLVVPEVRDVHPDRPGG